MQRSALCRSRRELSNAYLLAKFGFNTAENEPCNVCPLSVYRSPRFDLDKSGMFDFYECINILEAVGVYLTQQYMHDQYLNLYHSVDEDDNDCIDFGEFLLLMRRLVDMDFGGIAMLTKPKDKEETIQDRKKDHGAVFMTGGGGGRNVSANFELLVLGSIEADFASKCSFESS